MNKTANHTSQAREDSVERFTSPEDAAPKPLPVEPIDSRLTQINQRLAELAAVQSALAAQSVPVAQPVAEPEHLTVRAVWQAVLRKIFKWANS